MRETTPTVYLWHKPQIVWDEVVAYLEAVGGTEWSDRVMSANARGEISDAEVIVEAYGRGCYKSWAPGINANVTKVREDSAAYLRNIIDVEHGSVLEHPQPGFFFADVSRVFCYDDDTDVLTEDGWVPWPKIEGDERFATVNQETGVLEYQKASEIYHLDHDGPMYRVCSEQVDLLVTPNHRMWVQPFDTQAYRRGEQPYVIREAQDILGKRVRYQKCAVWHGEDPGEVEIPASERRYTVAGREKVRPYPSITVPVRPLARFLGYFLSEGCINQHNICLAQNRGPVLDRMAESIKGMGLHPYLVPEPHAGGVRVSQVALKDWLGRALSWEKRVPEIVGQWTPDIIREFLDAYVEGDGSERKDGYGHQVIYTTSPGMADDLQVLAIKAGWSANIRVDDRTGLRREMASGQVFYNQRPCYVVSIIKKRTRPTVNLHRRKTGQQDEMVDYSGRVHCATVPNGLLFVRRNGKPVVSHNTHELVRHRAGVAISQESLRYVRLTDLGFRVPDILKGKEVRTPQPRSGSGEYDDWDQDATTPSEDYVISIVERLEEAQVALADAFGLDDDGVPFSVKKEVTSALRRLAPIGLSTNIGWSANFRTLRFVIGKRTEPAAEEEIRLVFDQVARRCIQEWPMIFGDFEPQHEIFDADGKKVGELEIPAWISPHPKV